MKYLTIALLILSLVSTPAFGKLGEDEKKARNRYGDPVKEEQVQNYDKKVYYNEKQPLYNLSILYKDGKAVIINYQLTDQGSLSLWRIEHILHRNIRQSGRRSTWYFNNKIKNPEQVNFINYNRDATATYYLKDNTLTIRTVNK
ncbi:MAG: hypothetical protein ABFR35_05600 [Thermodesulfobacteriota bacterium]